MSYLVDTSTKIRFPRKNLFARFVQSVLRLDSDYRDARRLEEMTDTQLKDIGLEGRVHPQKPAWDAPEIMKF